MKTIIKKIQIIASLLVIIVTSSVMAQNDSIIKELPSFNSIVINSPMDVNLMQGNINSIVLKEGKIEDISAEVRDNTLFLKGKVGNEIQINFIELNKLELLSNCDIVSNDTITSDILEVILKGAASDVYLTVNTKNLTSIVLGAGDIKYTGFAEKHSIEIRGAGDINAYDLATSTTNISINGAGDVKVDASDELRGEINGAGEIYYLKDPITKDIKVNGLGSYSLKKEETSDTTKIRLGNKKLIFVDVDDKEKSNNKREKESEKFNIYWAGIGLGVNGYLNSNNKTNIPTGYDFLELDYEKSVNVAINFWEEEIPIWKEHINIVSGLGVDISNYRFLSNYKLIPDTNFITGIYDSSKTYTKNKLVATYLDVPLLLQFDTAPFGKKKKTVHLSTGIVGGIRIGSHTKQVYMENNTKDQYKTRDQYNLNPFRYSAMLRCGVGKLDIYATYTLSELFKKNQGPQLYPFTVGITLAGF